MLWLVFCGLVLRSMFMLTFLTTSILICYFPEQTLEQTVELSVICSFPLWWVTTTIYVVRVCVTNDTNLHNANAKLVFVETIRDVKGLIYPDRQGNGINEHDHCILTPHTLVSAFVVVNKIRYFVSDSAFHIAGLCEGNPLVSEGFPLQNESNDELWCICVVILKKL